MIRLLLVDDHAAVRQALRLGLKAYPDLHIVAEAERGDDAVKLACELKPEVTVMDISMPGVDGIAATKQIVTRCPQVRVIGLTMHQDAGLLQDMLEAGAVGLHAKDGDITELVAKIRRVAGLEGNDE